MTIFGWDMSRFDSPSIGNAVGEGISFIIHKAGGDLDDPEIGAWWSGVKGLGNDILLGAYWVLLPGNPVGRADAFIARLDSQCPGWRDRPFYLMADCEEWNNDPSTKPSEAEIQAFCDRLAVRMPKLRPLAYAPPWAYGNTLTGLRYPLVASRYVTGSGSFRGLYPGDGAGEWNPYSGQTPAVLQYSSSATIGGQSTSDANAFRGTLAELVALVAPGWSTMATLDAEDLAAIKAAVWGADIDPTASGSYTAGGALWTILGRSGVLPAQIAALGTAATAADIAAALVGPLSTALVAAIGVIGVTITEAQLQAALVAALKQLAGTQ